MPLSEYEETLLQEEPDNPYRETLRLEDDAQQTALRVSMKSATSKTPERQAEIFGLSQRTGLPSDVIDRNFDAIQKRSQITDTDYSRMLQESPKLSSWVADPNNMALAKDDLGTLGQVEQALTRLTDLSRAAGGATLGFVGGTVQAASQLMGMGGRAFRSAVENKIVIDQKGVRIEPSPWKVDPNSTIGKAWEATAIALDEAGQAWKQMGELVAPPVERQNLATAIVGGAGQFVPLIAASVLAPEAVVPMLFAQGVNQVADQVEQDKASQLNKDLAALPGGAVMASAGKMGFSLLVERAPLVVRNAVLSKLLDVGAAGGIQAADQFMMDVINGVARKVLTAPEAPLLPPTEGENVVAGAGTGALVRTVLQAVTGFRMASHFASQRQELQKMGASLAESKTAERSPEKAHEFMTMATHDGPVEHVYLPVQEIQAFAQQQQINPAEFMDAITSNGAAKLELARTTGEDVQVPLADYATKIANSEHADFFNDVIRLGDPEAMNLREAEAQLQLLAQPAEPVSPEETARQAEADQVQQATESAELEQAIANVLPPEMVDGAATPPNEGFLERIEREAKERIQTRGTLTGERLPAGLPLDDIADIVIIGAAKIARGTRDFAVWSRDMLAEYGDRIRPHLRDLYQRAVSEAGQRMGLKDEELKEARTSLLADNAILEAELHGQAEPLFPNAESAGMTPEGYAMYQQDWRATHDERRQVLHQQLLQQMKRAAEADREGIRTEVQQDLANRPEYLALNALQKGIGPDGEPLEIPIKLSKDAIVQMKGKDFLKQLPRPYVYAVKDGIHPDQAAERLGFASGDELLRSLVATPPLKDAVETETDARIRARYPTMLTDQTMNERARDVTMTTGRAEMIQREQQLLVRRAQRAATPADSETALKAQERERAYERRWMEAERKLSVAIAEGRKQAEIDQLREEFRTADKERRAGRALLRTLPPISQVRRLAEQRIAGMTVRELQPNAFRKAAQQAGRLAFEAVQRQDFETAFQEKQREQLNVQLYQASLEAQKNVTKARDLFQKFFRSDADIAKTRNMDYVTAARAIAAKLMFPGRAGDVAEAFDQLKTYDPATYEVLQSMLPNQFDAIRDFRDTTTADFRALHDIAEGLWNLARRDQSLRIDEKLVSREEATNQLKDRLGQLSSRFGGTGVTGLPTSFEHAERWFLGGKAWGRRVESWVTAMDGGPEGPFRTYLWNPVKDAVNRYRVRKVEELTKYRALLEPIQHTLTADKIAAPELNYTFGRDGSGGRAELLGALLHSGNRNDPKSNLAKLLVGRKWGTLGQDGMTLDSSRWDGFIQRMQREGVLTKADYDFAQGVWDLFESLKPDLQRTHRDVYGFYFDEVLADGFDTPFGSYRGGYVPALTDPVMSKAAEIRNEKQMTFEQGTSWALPSAGKKSTIARVQVFEPLAMNLAFIPQHLDWALRFTEIQPAVKDATRLIADKGFRAVLDAHDPEAASTMLMPWLMRAATQRVSEKGKWKGLDRFMTAVRARTGLQVLSFNVGNALQQLTGGFVAAVKIENKRNLANAAWRYFRSPVESGNFIREQSPFMQTFLTSQAMEIQKQVDDILLNPSIYAKSADFLKQHSSILASGTQNMVNHVAWLAAHEEAISQGADPKEAVRRADSVVRETQGSFFPEDISRFEANTPFVRAISMFASYFNMDANLLMTETGNAIRSDRGTFARTGRILSVMTLGFMLPAVISKAILNAISGDWQDDHDDTHIDELLNLFLGSQAQTAFSMLPVAGQFATAAYNALMTNSSYDDDIRSSPTAGMIGSAIKDLAGHASKKQETRDFLSILGLISNLPLGALGRPLGYLIDVGEGKAKAENVLDVTRGLVSGRTPPK